MIPAHVLPGFVWSREWESPYEGPYTLLAKMHQATCVPASYMREYVKDVGTHGTSFRFLEAKGPKTDRKAAAGRLLFDASRSPSWRMTSFLSDDSRFRYCPECMRHAYHTAVAQIVALERCPIHDCAHVTTCLSCDAPTPPYRLMRRGPGPTFNCLKCGNCLAVGSQIDTHVERWSAPAGIGVLKPIVDWLVAFEAEHCFHWENSHEWCSTSDIFDHERWQATSKAAFRILQAIRPGPVPLVDSDVKVWGPFPIGRPEEIAQAFAEHFDEVLREVLPCVDMTKYAAKFSYASVGFQVPLELGVPPEVHAVALTRSQFYRYAVNDKDCNSVQSKRIWTSRLVLGAYSSKCPAPSWGRELVRGYVTAFWEAALRIAQQWQAKVAELGARCSDEELLEHCRRLLPPEHLGHWEQRHAEPVAAIVERGDFGPGSLQAYFAIG